MGQVTWPFCVAANSATSREEHRPSHSCWRFVFLFHVDLDREEVRTRNSITYLFIGH